ncbi:MAG: 2-oxoglutarate and iron-dependent oxygenase domain-containing protein [Actinomycetia bacterium]|nr:2-oxoglutarate and iron-dependent oxygenase domain-containing protein [Actinomycetes bacterium]
MTDTLPILDLSLADDPATAETFRTALREATIDMGFFYLVGHGISTERMAEMFELSRRFFALSQVEKEALAMLESPAFHGWTRLGGELTQDKVDWREQIDIGPERTQGVATADEPWRVLDGPNLWPDALPELRATVETWMSDLTDVGRRLLEQWALALGQDADIFDGAFGESPSPLLKLVRYPAVENPDPAGDQGVGAHKDPGVLTLLLLEEGSTGLQVAHAGGWIEADPVPGAFVVNIGEMLEIATDGLLTATDHRVLSPAAGQERISIPFFLNPALGARLPELDLPADLAERARGVSQDERNVLHATFGANMLKARLRAHPDVAGRHHPQLLG